MKEEDTNTKSVNGKTLGKVSLSRCRGKPRCLRCSWAAKNGGFCKGCDYKYQQQCIKRTCILNCYSCSGGKHAWVPGCCGHAKASWRRQWDELLKYRIPVYTPKPVRINCRLIPIIYAQIKKYRIPEYFPQIDGWAVPIHKVANRKGQFRSQDLKGYLGLPNDRKLILSTCAPDDYQEVLWSKGPKMDYKCHNIDYWFPGHFSVYDNDSKRYQFANAKRQQIHAVWTNSQFVWFRLGAHIPVAFLKPIRKAPSVLISTNQMFSSHNKKILLDEVKIADKWFPAKTSFFVVGSSCQLPIMRKRICYQINTNWLMRSLMGRNMTRQKLSKKKFPMDQVLINNLKEVMANVYSTKS